MNKKILIGLIVLVIVAAAVVAVFIMNSNKKPEGSTSDTTAGSDGKLSAVKACDLLTLAEAKQLLGDAATAGDNTVPASSKDISVDNCSYTNNATSVPAIRTVTIMVRSALTQSGLQSNQAAFEQGGAANPNGAIAVEAYGEKAAWDPMTHQLAVLKDNSWVGIIYGGTNPANNTLDDAKKVADFVFN